MDKNIVNFIKQKKPSNAYIYNRVSTGRQAQKDSHSLQDQKKICTEYIKEYFPNLNNFLYDDIGSSYNGKQVLTQLNKLVLHLKENSIIIVSRISRLGRNIKQVMDILRKIEKKKSYVISVEESICWNMSKVMNNNFLIKVIESEKESNILSETIIKRQSNIKKLGGYVGKPPYGYKIIKNNKNIPVLVENSIEIDIVNKIIDLANKNYSYENISLYLNNKSIGYRKNTWTSNSVKYILDKFYLKDISIEFNTIFNKNSNINIISDIFNEYKSTNMEIDSKFIVLRSGKCIYK